MKKWRLAEPYFIENSKIPVLLSFIAPINIWAISFGFWVWCRGSLDEDTKRHETIHFQQQIELLFIFQWLLYIIFWLYGLLIYRNGEKAYRQNPFEQEAYEKDKEQFYLLNRKRYSWWSYKI